MLAYSKNGRIAFIHAHRRHPNPVWRVSLSRAESPTKYEEVHDYPRLDVARAKAREWCGVSKIGNR